MPNVAHIATIAAYPIKEELGGGFRGVFKKVGEDREPSDRFETLAEAKFWAQDKAWKAYKGCRFASLYKHGEYQANVWIDA